MNVATKDPIERLSHAPAVLPARIVPPAIAPATWMEGTAILIMGLTAVRWAVASATGLSDTEAYYASWSRVLALSYYDHPPLVAWSNWLFSRLGGGAASVRLGPVLYAAAFDLLIYRLASRLFSPRAGFFAVAIAAATPVLFFTGFLLNPEALLAPLWVLFLLLLVDLRDHDERWRPLAIGAVVGVAFLAKYTAILAVPVVLLAVATSVESRRWLRRPSFYLGGLVALAIASPVVAWNAMHDWPSLQLHLSDRMSRVAGESLGAALWRVGSAQLVYFHPLMLPAFVGVLGYALWRARRDARYRVLAVASLPVLAFLLTMMVRAGDSEPHWTIVGYVPLMVGAAGVLDESTGALQRAGQWVFRASLVVSAVAFAVYPVHVRSPALAKALPHYNPAADPLTETLGWDSVSAAVAAHASHLGAGAVAAGAHNVLCGHLEMAIDDTPSVYCASPHRTEFDFIARRSPPADVPVVFVDSDRYPADALAALPDHTCGPADDVTVERGGLVLATYRLRDCVPGSGGAP
jgi:hypothetical protein